MIKLVVAEIASDKTGPWLKEALREAGVRLARDEERADGVVSLGVHLESERPTLNANGGLGRGKLQQLLSLQDADVRVPEIRTNQATSLGPGVWFGRQRNHTGGRDIKLYLQPTDHQTYGPSDFYVKFMPSKAEWRTWVFRGEALASYLKVLKRPELARLALGRNESNGWAFEFKTPERVPQAAKNLAVAAVAACKLDFGAVDLLHGEDGEFYALEVNTAPGANGRNSVAIKKLARRIARWEQAGYPRRVPNA